MTAPGRGTSARRSVEVGAFRIPWAALLGSLSHSSTELGAPDSGRDIWLKCSKGTSVLALRSRVAAANPAIKLNHQQVMSPITVRR